VVTYGGTRRFLIQAILTPLFGFLWWQLRNYFEKFRAELCLIATYHAIDFEMMRRPVLKR
jgi:hypothetical protein